MKLRTIFGFGLLLTLLGCSKLTLENYNKIQVGMPYEEVTSLIGNPKQCSDVIGIRNCEWGNDSRSANVSFAGGKVLLFASHNLD